MAGLRLCLYCGEFAVVPGEWDEICPECKIIHGVMNRPELPDVGDCECWFDGSDNKIHHCQQRRALAKKQTSEGKTPVMPQCAICETKPEYMPRNPVRFGDIVVSVCESCGKEYYAATTKARFCRPCKDIRKKDSDLISSCKARRKRRKRCEI